MKVWVLATLEITKESNLNLQNITKGFGLVYDLHFSFSKKILWSKKCSAQKYINGKERIFLALQTGSEVNKVLF